MLNTPTNFPKPTRRLSYGMWSYVRSYSGTSMLSEVALRASTSFLAKYTQQVQAPFYEINRLRNSIRKIRASQEQDRSPYHSDNPCHQFRETFVPLKVVRDLLNAIETMSNY